MSAPRARPAGAGAPCPALLPRSVARQNLQDQPEGSESYVYYGFNPYPIQINLISKLFSMLASAATCGLGVALLPTMLVQAELMRNELVVLCDRPISSRRAYYVVTPETAAPVRALACFVAWLQDEVASDLPKPSKKEVART